MTGKVVAVNHESAAAEKKEAAADAKAPNVSALEPSNAKSNDQLRAAAEPFEKLTEISVSATFPAIDLTIGKAEAAARGVRKLLSKNAADELAAQLSAMKSARQKHDRSGLALSSIEAYRVLVSAVTDNAKTSKGVSLLDYAGFRYDADLKASPIRWDDMALAVAFARETWNALSPRAQGSPVATRFEKAITDMERAVPRKSKSLAASSVKMELDLVDQFEKFFALR